MAWRRWFSSVSASRRACFWVGSKYSMRWPPRRLARAMACSAWRVSWVWSVAWSGNTAMPTLAEMKSSLPSMCSGRPRIRCSSSMQAVCSGSPGRPGSRAMKRSAPVRASQGLVVRRRRRRSGPVWRLTRSSSRWLTAFRKASPMAWPRPSLSCRKRSRSSSMSVQARGVERSTDSSRRMKPVWLVRPVSRS